MKFINKLLSKYYHFRKKRRIATDEKWKKYYLSRYGVYHNADNLTRDRMLEIFWKMLENRGYNPSDFDSNTSTYAPSKQDSDWGDLGGIQFAVDLDRMFGFSKNDITDNEYGQIKTFGELADLVIRKAKEKKLKQHNQ